MQPYIPQPYAVQFELSSICNLKCYGCVRVDSTTWDTSDAFKKNVTLDLEVFKRIIDSEIVQQHVKKIEFCGVIDEPTSHPQFLDMLRYIAGRFQINIHSNCSVRRPAYWHEMAEILKGTSHCLLANIDGLEDTNHIYRRGANWNKIVENVKAFCDNDGEARWQMLVFPWNEHQVEDVKKFAKSIGCYEFKSRHNRSYLPDFDDKGNPIPEEPDLIDWEGFVEENDQKSNQPDNEIQCKFQEDEMYFVSYDGKLWPCCFIANRMVDTSDGYEVLEKMNERYSHYGENWNCLYTRSFDDIVKNDFYTNDLVESFGNTSHGTGKCDRIIKCTNSCTQKRRIEVPFQDINENIPLI